MLLSSSSPFSSSIVSADFMLDLEMLLATPFFREPEDPLLISQFSWLELALLIPPDEDDETLAALLPETVVDGPLVTTDCPSGACDC
jgi:hypothetical protein